jgi:cardiolipin synthase
VGSTNLNVASWLGNYELDIIAEDRPFAALMETMYRDDLTNATEVVLDRRHRPSKPPGATGRPLGRMGAGVGRRPGCCA